MTSLLIVGAGGHGKVVADSAAEIGRWKKLAFLDDRYPSLQRVGIWPVAGALENAPEIRHYYPDAVVAIGSGRRRLEVLEMLIEIGYRTPVIVHPTAFVSRFAELGGGTVVLPNAVIHTGAKLGVGCIVNTAATVDHDCTLEDGVHLSPGAHLAGEVHVGRCTWIGVGASIRNRTRIGSDAVVGVGAAVVSDLPDDVTAVGVPARIQNDA